MSKGIYCALAHTGASISQYQVKPCCNLDASSWPADHNTSNLDFNHTNLVQLRKDLLNGTWPDACVNCKINEDNGYDSMRLRWNNRLPENEASEFRKHQMAMSEILFLDITIDTFCNSKCMMCGPGASSFWEREHSYIWGDNAPAYELAPSNRVNFTHEHLQRIAKETIKLQQVSFLGGEPTISDLHFDFLKMLVDTGRSSNICLSYVTNLTGITQEMLDIWNKFKKVSLTVSIDGYGLINEYIRYPIKWDKTIATLEKAKNHNLDISVSCTISVFNCLDTVELFSWWEDFAHDIENSNFIMNRVMVHEYNNLSLLSNQYRQQGIPKLQEFVNRAKYSYMKDNAQQMIGYLMEPQNINSKSINDLKQLITRSDQFRKRSIDDYIPGLLAEIDQQQKNIVLPKTP